jgi:putative hydrolase of the HAD superfamily
VRPRALVFDLWETLVSWPIEESRLLRQRSASHFGITPERFDELWYEDGAYERRESGPLRAAYETIAATVGSDSDLDELVAWRVDLARLTVVPSPAVLGALRELRQREYLLAVISNCTEEVAIVWPDTELAPLFDAAVFSSVAGCMKPDPRIYALATDALGVDAGDCLFVGDGANDELAGAERVGMTPVLIHRAGEDPAWDGLREWAGMRITSIPEVLELVP